MITNDVSTCPKCGGDLKYYPHGGTFEIPELTVNNKNPTAVSVLGKNIRDAVGINPKVAERLSGADFDGDQVVVIPTGGRVKIQSTPALKDLKDFDPKTDYSTEGKTGVRLLAKGAARGAGVRGPQPLPLAFH